MIPIPQRLVLNERDGRLSIAVTILGVKRIRLDGLPEGAKAIDCWAPDPRGLVQVGREPEREMSGAECAVIVALLERITELARGLLGIEEGPQP